MTRDTGIKNLTRLVALRHRDMERTAVDVFRKRGLSERYQRNLEQLRTLCFASRIEVGATGISPLLRNEAQYKAALIEVIDRHQQALALHEADRQVAEQALAAATRRHDSLAQVLAVRHATLKAARARQENRQQDEAATQMWLSQRV